MTRVAKPLRLMGASVDGDTLPLTIRGGNLKGVEYQPDVASAQVKSCILLAPRLCAARKRACGMRRNPANVLIATAKIVT